MKQLSQKYRQARIQDMRNGSALRRAHAWLMAFAASCGLIPTPFTFAVTSVKNGPSRPLEHPS
jgi:hypothetical protein